VLGWTIPEALEGLNRPPRQITSSERRRLELVANFERLDEKRAAAVAALVRALAGAGGAK
jgi:hypothetical protein